MGSPIHKKQSSHSAQRAAHSAKHSNPRNTIVGTPLFLQRQSKPKTGTTLNPTVQPQATALKKQITAKLDAIIKQAKAIDTNIKAATANPKKLGNLSFPGRPDKTGNPATEALSSIIKKTVKNHNDKATLAIETVLQASVANREKYHVTEAEVLAALRAANTYSADQWNEWAGSKTGQWDEKWKLSEIWAEATTTLPVKKYTGIWQDAYWFVDGKTRQDLEKVGFNLTLNKPDGSTLVMGFDPKSNESANKANPDAPKTPLKKEPMNLNSKIKLAKGAQRGYPFTTKNGHLGIVWVSGAEVFVESLIKVQDPQGKEKRIKISGSLWGSGRWEYE